jgi:putative FmdB family regulatory protein
MPTYVYKREDGSTFEIEQRITEPALKVCPTTGQKVKRIISTPAGLLFKGSGFYLTDYARSATPKPSGDTSPSTGSGHSDNGADKKAPKAESGSESS